MITTQHFLTALASRSSQVVSYLWLSTHREGGQLSLLGKEEEHLIFIFWTAVSILSLDIVVSQNNVFCCCCSVTKSCRPLCDTKDCSMPGCPVFHCPPEFAQIYAHWVSDAIWPSHFLLPTSIAFNLSQHQGLFQWVSSLYQVAKIFYISY